MKRTLLAALLVVAVTAPAAADTDDERAKRLSGAALHQVLAGYQAFERGDFAGAVRAWRSAALVAPHRVQYLYAELLTGGRGGPADLAEAATVLTEAATQGHAEGQARLAAVLDAAGDAGAAVHWYVAAAAQGRVDAEFALGGLFETGRGVPQDFGFARAWYLRAAQAGDAHAQNNLGALYAEGRVPDPTGRAAAGWFGLAAAQGLAEAQLNLGALYDRGRGGLKQDNAVAYAWFTLAARQGHVGAKDMAGVVGARLTAAQRGAADRSLGSGQMPPRPPGP